MKRLAIYPGTFDPVTLGHMDVIRRAALVCDRLIVGVARNKRKDAWFTLEERVALLREATKGISNVEVKPFEGLLVNFARKEGVHVVVRGLRAFSDFEYEFQMALTNRKLAPDIETMFLMTSETHSYISSSAVREVAELGGDTSVFVPPCVRKALANKSKAREKSGKY